jgi:hypothetical protein
MADADGDRGGGGAPASPRGTKRPARAAGLLAAQDQGAEADDALGRERDAQGERSAAAAAAAAKTAAPPPQPPPPSSAPQPQHGPAAAAPPPLRSQVASLIDAPTNELQLLVLKHVSTPAANRNPNSGVLFVQLFGGNTQKGRVVLAEAPIQTAAMFQIIANGKSPYKMDPFLVDLVRVAQSIRVDDMRVYLVRSGLTAWADQLRGSGPYRDDCAALRRQPGASHEPLRLSAISDFSKPWAQKSEAKRVEAVKADKDGTDAAQFPPLFLAYDSLRLLAPAMLPAGRHPSRWLTESHAKHLAEQAVTFILACEESTTVPRNAGQKAILKRWLKACRANAKNPPLADRAGRPRHGRGGRGGGGGGAG